jgi:hypothetical protein
MKVGPEKVEFAVSIDSWSEFYQPGFEISIDKDLIATVAEMTRGKTYLEKFSHTIDPGQHELKIRLLTPGGQSSITINSIYINQAELILVDRGQYNLDRPKLFDGNTTSNIKKMNTMGWPGEYTVRFSSPTVIWFLTEV